MTPTPIKLKQLRPRPNWRPCRACRIIPRSAASLWGTRLRPLLVARAGRALQRRERRERRERNEWKKGADGLVVVVLVVETLARRRFLASASEADWPRMPGRFSAGSPCRLRRRALPERQRRLRSSQGNEVVGMGEERGESAEDEGDRDEEKKILVSTNGRGRRKEEKKSLPPFFFCFPLSSSTPSHAEPRAALWRPKGKQWKAQETGGQKNNARVFRFFFSAAAAAAACFCLLRAKTALVPCPLDCRCCFERIAASLHDTLAAKSKRNSASFFRLPPLSQSSAAPIVVVVVLFFRNEKMHLSFLPLPLPAPATPCSPSRRTLCDVF